MAPSLIGELTDAALLAELASRSDVLTFDWENIPGSALKPLRSTDESPAAASGARSLARSHSGKSAVFKTQNPRGCARRASKAREQLLGAVQKIGLPGVLKTRRLGYDGKGQFVLRSIADIDAAWAAIGADGLIYEKFQEFSREVSLVGSALGGRTNASFILSPPILTPAAFCATASPRL